MLVTSVSPRGIVRTSGLVPATDSHSVLFQVKIAAAPSAGNFSTLWYYGDPVSSYTDYIWIGQLDTGQIEIDIGALDSGIVPNLGIGWHEIGYTRSGTTHKIYVDGILYDTMTANIAAWTIAEEYVGTDTGAWLAAKYQYFREWNASLTASQMLAESMSATPIITTGLWCNTPLVSNLLDDSGNTRDWAFDGGTSTFVASEFTPGTYNKWYVNSTEETPYIPATTYGGWNLVNSVSIQNLLFDPRPQFSIGEGIGPRSGEAAIVAPPYKICIYTLVTLPLAAQTLSGSLDFVVSMLENTAAADFYTKVYAWVTVGDSDTQRGVLLDYAEASGGGDTEWPTTAVGRALTSRQQMNPVIALEGDRIIIEFGVTKFSASGTVKIATTQGGSSLEPGIPVPDLTVNSTNVTTERCHWDFIIPPILSNVTPSNVNFETAVDLTGTLPVALTTIDPTTISINLFYKYTADGTENGAISFFLGKNAAGNLIPFQYVWRQIPPATYPNIYSINGSWLNTNQAVLEIPVIVGETYYIQFYDGWALNPPDASYQYAVEPFPTPLPADFDEALFSMGDFVIRVLEPSESIGGIIDPVTGELLTLDFSLENLSERAAAFRKRPFIGNIAMSQTYPGNIIRIIDNQLNLVVSLTGYIQTPIAGPSGDREKNPPINFSDSFFYVGQYIVADAEIHVRRFYPDGSTAIGSWDFALPLGANKIYVMCPTKNDSILYFASNNLGGPIYAYNLLSSTLTGAVYTYGVDELIVDIWGLADGTFVTGFGTRSGVDVVAPSLIRHFDADWNLINEWEVPATYDSVDYFLDRIALSKDETAVWAWMQFQSDPNLIHVEYIYTLIRLSDGVVLKVLDNVNGFEHFYSKEIAPGDTPTEFFGVPDSCALLVMLVDNAPPPLNIASGIYKIVPGKRQDTLWVSFDPVETEDVKIPRPSAKGAYLGE